ncbi:uncharacterized protein [Gossypium hirsutum]|uniref:Uncharacterized protein isoform X4 n=1 Tax=Gossypium hirsutum TaxID=3635 RepID=A0ABM3BTW0_GOSHI|nr:uncharacterized protein LOC107944816 isoform X4 [Gossypium hirsutum]XP_040970451.1 uncharacterized protein LOC107944816 isoform X4 [Gossypium hirsutum]XP_040970452.1 uncharacterized protein LOC107944816 isoform X4 [Gossypium hirsutum]XP_040970453.1 uncharacterized protein LOC107944816 isoform X4 [Gossypium hirsutum]
MRSGSPRYAKSEFYFITMDMVFQSQLQMVKSGCLIRVIHRMVVCLPSLALSAAEMVVNAFIELLDCGTSNYPGSSRDCILLAACEAHETLPQSAEFPAYVFTSCLTTPIKMTLRWCILWLSVPVFWILWRLN